MSIPSHTQDRDFVFRTAARDPEAALRVAKGIAEPWFRCQALAAVAEHGPDPAGRRRLLAEAFEAALATREPNRIASASSWPLAVLCRLGEARLAAREADRLLDLLSGEPSPVRRADALGLLLGATAEAPLPVFRNVFEALECACFTRLQSGAPNRKGESLLAGLMGLVHSRLPGETGRVLARFHSDPLRQNATRALSEFGAGR